MKRLPIILLVNAVFLFSSLITCYASSQKDYGAWWVDNYGALTEKEYPLVARVKTVFNHVLAAADKRANRYPKLVILRQVGDPWAICLPDGTVLLTQKAMEMCYQDVDKRTGDARLAFILGHELAHLAKDDFWHFAAFEAVQKFGSGKKAEMEIRELLFKTEDIKCTVHSMEIVRKKELQADSYGIIYASMAGYDPAVIVDTKGKNFFKEWVSQITGKVAYSDEQHPTPEQRAEFLLANIKSVRDVLDLFYFGVRLYQLARYEDALIFLEAFKEKFPCREVYNNLGLIHYQMAINYLAKCDRNRAYQYKLATVLDTETRAASFTLKGATRGDDCPQMARFNEQIQDAIRDFKTACEKDTSYIPARVNLSSAMIMAGNYSGAMAVLDEALKLKKDDAGALSNRAVAMYLLGPSIKVDMFAQAINVLKEVVKKNKGFSDAAYNMARLLLERGRNAAAKENWKEFLNLESTGVYADIARQALGMEKEAIAGKKKPSPEFIEPSPVKLGDYDDKTEKQLAGLAKRDIELGIISGERYSGNNIRVLIMDFAVELVESPVKRKISVQEIISTYGEPRTIFNSPSGVNTWLYDSFALDVQDGAVIRAVYFAKDFI